MMDRKHVGAHNELLASVWLLKQGYEVFRNVSQHGLVDIVAMKDGATVLFDVKQAAFTIDGKKSQATLTAGQIALEVKVINVYPDATCFIDWFPQAKSKNGRRLCLGCGTEFHSNTKRARFCSTECRVGAWKTRKAEIRAMRAIT